MRILSRKRHDSLAPQWINKLLYIRALQPLSDIRRLASSLTLVHDHRRWIWSIRVCEQERESERANELVLVWFGTRQSEWFVWGRSKRWGEEKVGSWRRCFERVGVGREKKVVTFVYTNRINEIKSAAWWSSIGKILIDTANVAGR